VAALTVNTRRTPEFRRAVTWLHYASRPPA
jgi:hypothetical protein